MGPTPTEQRAVGAFCIAVGGFLAGMGAFDLLPEQEMPHPRLVAILGGLFVMMLGLVWLDPTEQPGSGLRRRKAGTLCCFGFGGAFLAGAAAGVVALLSGEMPSEGPLVLLALVLPPAIMSRMPEVIGWVTVGGFGFVGLMLWTETARRLILSRPATSKRSAPTRASEMPPTSPVPGPTVAVRAPRGRAWPRWPARKHRDGNTTPTGGSGSTDGGLDV